METLKNNLEEQNKNLANFQEEQKSNPEQEANPQHKDVLFFDAPYHSDQELAYSMIKDSGQNMDLPRGMLSISSYMQQHELTSSVIPLDSYIYPEIQDLSQAEMTQKMYNIIDQKVHDADPKIIAFGLMYTFTEPIVLEMTSHTKSKFPDKKVVVGGNHATFSDLELLDPSAKTGIDIVVRFEGEETMVKLTQELQKPNPDLAKIKGISYVNERGKIVQNSPRERMNLYQIPPLDYSSIDSPEGLEKFNQTAMFIRGCKGNCAFCTSPNYWSRELSENSINNFEQELEFLAKNGVEIIGILDDDILASEQGFESIIKSLEKIKTKYPTTRFIAQTRVTHFRNPEQNQEKLTKMKQAGVDRLYVGIESGSQQILNQMAKGYKVEWVKPALENIKDAGIETGGFWLFGHPGATKEEENRSLAFMEELLEKRLLDDVEAHCVVPFPGTRIAKDLRVQVFDHNKKHYGFLNNYPVYNLVNPETGKIEMSASEIFGFLQQALEIRKKYLGIEANLANRPLEKN